MPITVRIREAEADEQQPSLLWDTVWPTDNQNGSWSLAHGEAGNIGGLRAQNQLRTAIMLSLFTWRGVEDHELTEFDGNDRKGWWGDGVDLETHETALGSKLWLLQRAVLNDQTAMRAQAYAIEALQPLIAQGLVARFDVTAAINQQASRLELNVLAFAKSGAQVFNQRFTSLWQQEFR